MKIQKLILSQYNRFALSEIPYICIDFSTPMQLILGTNGSGKSSLLSELTPLPANPQDFEKGGFKELHVNFKGDEFIIRSDISRGAKHSFIKNGTELNPGGTALVQKDMVERELGYTTALHTVLTGKMRFTQMAPAKRREWIAKLSTTDMSYAHAIFDAVKVAARDNQGALKHVKEKVSQQQARLVSLEAASNLQDRVDECHKDIEALLTDRQSNTPTPQDIKQQIQSRRDNVLKLSKRLLTTDLSPWIKTGFTTVFDFEEAIVKLQLKEAELKAKRDNYTETLHDLQTMLTQMDRLGAVSLDDLLKKRAELEERQTLIAFSGEWDIPKQDAEALYRDVTSAFVPLRDWAVEMPTQMKPEYNKAAYQEAVEYVKGLERETLSLKRKLESLQHRIQHMKQARELECPKCNYIWRPGVSENELKESLVQQETISNLIDSKDREYKGYVEKLEAYQQYVRNLNRLQAIMESYPRCSALWERVKRDKHYDTSPLQIMHTYDTFKDYVMMLKDQQALDDEIALIDASIKKCHESKGLDGLEVEKRVEELERRLDDVIKAISKTSDEIARLQTGKGEFDRYFKDTGVVSDALVDLESLRDQLIESQRQSVIGSVLQERQQTLSVLSSTLNQKVTLEQMIAELRESQAQLETETQGWQDLQHMLSPATGIIADQMTGFIKCLLDQMNTIIAKVWHHRLVVLPCANQSGTLDYKFPFVVGEDDKRVGDVGLGSEGQMEMIDFAFMVTVMHFMDLHEYPMLLDETGRTFDAVHRNRLMGYIKLLVETGQASQLFLVNHFASFSGGFTNAEFCVLDDQNVSLPSTYNEHVSFTA